MTTFLQQVVNGLSLGSIYAVFAIGCTLIFGVLNIVNLAQGAFFMVGAYLGLEIALLGLPLPLALVVALVGRRRAWHGVRAFWCSACSGCAAGTNGWALSPASPSPACWWASRRRCSAPPCTAIRLIPSPPSCGRSAALRVQLLQVIVVITAVILMGILGFTLQKTSVGRAIRTVAFSRGRGAASSA